MKKHAYLIMAHNEFDLLVKLLKELDDPRNDVYLHIDKKAGEFDEEAIRNSIVQSKLYMMPRMNVYWGHISQVKCELKLLRAASKGNYHYYHMISGTDFPLKSQDYIHDFLEDKDSLYLTCHRDGEPGYEFMFKLKYYYPLLRFVGKGVFKGTSLRDKMGRKLGYWQLRLTEIQEKKNIDRTKKHPDIDYYKGDNWFSIPHDFAIYILSLEKEIMKLFGLTAGSDEIFMQTMAMRSKFSDRVENNCLRKIDWNRGTPYEFTYEDLSELLESDAFFARKISYERQPLLVETLIKHIKGAGFGQD